jgi:hypothetical protein
MVPFDAGEQDVESLVQVGCSVVGGELGGEAADEGEFQQRQVGDAEAAQVFGLAGVDG